jgi:hypothetical protein
MISEDPRFLKGAFSVKKKVKGEEVIEKFNPKADFTSGQLSMRDALARPAFWDDQPNKNEYLAMEQYYTDIARQKGIHPADAQAAGWIGGGPVTGLGSDPEPFMFFVRQRAEITAQARGITPEQALKDFITGKAPLLGVPAAMAPAIMQQLGGGAEEQGAAA